MDPIFDQGCLNSSDVVLKVNFFSDYKSNVYIIEDLENREK